MATKKTQTAIAIAELTFEQAKGVVLNTAHAVHDMEVKLKSEVAAMFKDSINKALDAARREGADRGTVVDGMEETFADAVKNGWMASSSARCYMTGLRFAWDRGVAWEAGMHSTEVQIRALRDAGKKLPKSLEEKAKALDAQATEKRDAKLPKGPTKDSVCKQLAKAWIDATALGCVGWATHIREAIQAEFPEWAPPAADK
jgi:hypothetical protein